MAISVLLALGAAILVLVVGLFLTGNVRRRRLQKVEAGPSLFGRYLESLRADLEDAGLDGLTPLRALFYFVLSGVIVGLVVGVLFGLSLIGLVAALLTTVFFSRNYYVGSRARRVRRDTTAAVAEAAREIADSVDSGMSPLDAVKSYAGRSGPDAASEQLTGRINRVARALADAMARIERGMATEEALRAAVDPLANRFFSNLIEAYIQTAGIDAAQLVTSLRRVAREVDDAVLLREERAAAIAAPRNSNRIVGGVIGLILLVMNFLLPGSGVFFHSLIGQVFLLAVAVFWYLGDRFLASGYEESL